MESIEELGSQNAICAGGRYDSLVNNLGNINVPAIGLAMGVERIVELLKNQNHQNNEIIYPFVDEQGINNINFIKITDKIRKKYSNLNFFNTDTSASFKSQLKYAKKINSELAILINSSETNDDIEFIIIKITKL